MGTRTRKIFYCDICGENIADPDSNDVLSDQNGIEVHKRCIKKLPEWMRWDDLDFYNEAIYGYSRGHAAVSLDMFINNDLSLYGSYWLFINSRFEEKIRLVRFDSTEQICELLESRDLLDGHTWIDGCYYNGVYCDVKVTVSIKLEKKNQKK